MRWVNRHPKKGESILLGALPVAVLLIAYLIVAAQRHADNPMDKILPLPGQMMQAMSALMFQAGVGRRQALKPVRNGQNPSQ
ncbi:hypothetical protein [Blastomonas sp. UPD001]|uniref:hypothetical protein n=1 Tax=Blastomonas sp. UPD001 TaxID=2217673 RepID=UPI0018E4E6D5|nr:hypothetical protein [Blastomonas sp. UPD001]